MPEKSIVEREENYTVNKSYAKSFPNNCPVIERTADGERVGTCTFYLKDGRCPRHGLVKK